MTSEKNSTVLYLMLIWIAALAVRVTLFTGYMNGDMGNYIQEAHNVFAGHYSVRELLNYKSLNDLVPNANLNWQNLRLGLILPVGLLMKIFGVSDFSYALFTLFCFTLSYLLVYLLGKELVSRNFGLLSALIFSFIPLEINLSTVLLPHLPSATFMALSCYLFLKGTRANGGKYPFYYLCSGISLGVSYYIWEFSIILTPVFFLYMAATGGPLRVFVDRNFWRAFLLTALGFVPIMAIGIIYFHSISDVLFFQQKFISITSPKWMELHQVDTANLDSSIYLRSVTASYYFGIFYYFTFAGLLLLAFQKISGKNRSPGFMGAAMLLPVIWFLWLVLYLQFGTSSLSQYQPVFKMSHYLAAISIPASLLGGYFLYSFPFAKVLEKLKIGVISEKAIKISLVAAYLPFSVLCAYANFAGNGPFHRDMTNEHRLGAAISKLEPSAPIYTDVWTKNGLDFVLGYARPVVPFNSVDKSIEGTEFFRAASQSEMKHGYVVINNIYLTSKHTMNTYVPRFISDPPKEWNLVAKVFGNSGKRSIDIYRIAE